MDRDSDLSHALPRELAEAHFSRLYQDHAREILGYALRRTEEPEDAADVVAETFLVAWRRLGDVPLGGEARLWLYGTARNTLANKRRGEHRRTRLAARLREELRSQAAEQAMHDGGGLISTLATMSEADRELLMLVGWEELTPSQAARVLGISPLAARSRLHRARRRLRARLAEEPSGSSRGNEMEVEEAR